MTDEETVEGIFSNSAALEIELEIFESDESRNIRIYNFMPLEFDCQSGAALYIYCTTELPNSGLKCGISLTMNRAIKHFSNLKWLENTEDVIIVWRRCQPTLKAKIEGAFSRLVLGTPELTATIAVLTDGLLPKKGAAKRQALVQVDVDEGEEQLQHGGRLCDRIALLAYAIADPDLIQYWVRLSNPVDKSKRTALMDMDQGIVHEIAARWVDFAEVIMSKRETYVNMIGDTVITGADGLVLVDFDPSLGCFVDTPSLTKGAQLKALHKKCGHL